MEVQLLQMEKDNQQLETDNESLKNLVAELDKTKIEVEMKELKVSNRELKDNVESLEVEIGDLLEEKNQIQKSMLEELADLRSQNQWSKDVINQMNKAYKELKAEKSNYITRIQELENQCLINQNVIKTQEDHIQALAFSGAQIIEDDGPELEK